MNEAKAPPGAPAAPDAPALERALRAAGVPARVTADARLALVDAPAAAFVGRGARDEVLHLARAHGFTHAALLLDDGGHGPAVSQG